MVAAYEKIARLTYFPFQWLSEKKRPSLLGRSQMNITAAVGNPGGPRSEAANDYGADGGRASVHRV